MTVLIAGAGIGGLTLGLSLHQLGIDFHIYEKVPQIRPLGVGLNLQSVATRELFELDLEAELDKAGLRTEEVVYFSRRGQKIWSEPRGILAGSNWPQYSIHRGALQVLLLKALLARAGTGVLTVGASVTGCKEAAGGVKITLKDSRSRRMSVASGTVLVAADGINSAIRPGFYPDEGPAIWGGTMMWRGITRGPKLLTGRSMIKAGTKDCKFICYPIADTDDGGSLLNWIARLKLPDDYNWQSQDWNRTGDRANFAHHFADWSFDWLDVPKTIKEADGIWEFPMVDRNPLPKWSHGPVTLLGDAAHAMYPTGSNGAVQAIIDARILARELRDHGVGQGALQSYDDIRRESANAVVLANRADGPDTILDIVATRAPDGFAQIEDIMSKSQLQEFADRYKVVSGMTVEALNARPPISEG